MAFKRERNSVFRSVLNQNFHNRFGTFDVMASTKDSLDYVQRLGLWKRLAVHNGCVNTICWNSSGEYVLSGSDDQHIAITNPHNKQKLLRYRTTHHSNIFSARFMPQTNDLDIVTCAGDGVVLHTELLAPYVKRRSTACTIMNSSEEDVPMYEQGETHANVNTFNCHRSGTTYEVITIPSQPRTFMSCGEDGTVRFFDLRSVSNCHKTCCKDNILILNPTAVNSMDLSPINNMFLAVGSSDGIIRIYDRRFLSNIDFSDTTNSTIKQYTCPIKAFPIPTPLKRSFRVTSVKYSPDESALLANFSSEYLYLFDLKKDGVNVDEIKTVRPHDNGSASQSAITAEQVTRRLRLRGDWSDTGPEARPDDSSGRIRLGQVRPQLQANIMNRMTEVISRMLTDPRTRMGVGGLTSEYRESQESNTPRRESAVEGPSTSNAWRSAAYRSLQNSANSTNRTVTDADNQSPASNDGAHSDNGRSSTSHDITDNATGQDETSEINADLAVLDMDTKDIDYDYLMMKFVGHRNARTMIKEATFWGDNYVMSGSDCGHIFIWDRTSGKVVKIMEADQHVVNCLQPHPSFPYLASSGIDYDIKIWAPVLQEPDYNENKIDDLMKRNAIMLEQTKDTITVPAAFMIRMLACIHSLRNRERGQQQSTEDEVNNDQNEPNATND